MPTHFIQFTTVYANRIDVSVLQYGHDEMVEVFSLEERLELARGNIVKREDRYSKTDVVDLQAFFRAQHAAGFVRVA